MASFITEKKNEREKSKSLDSGRDGSDDLTKSSSNTTQKKRLKASRACDQCRKKKIKCDYNEERNACSNCQRNNETCAFERIPLKRGPSKGYNRASNTETTNANNRNNNKSVRSGSNDLNQDTSVVSKSIDPNKYGVITPTGSSSVLLPPLSQYIPQTNQIVSNNSINSTNLQQANDDVNINANNIPNNTTDTSQNINNNNNGSTNNSSTNIGNNNNHNNSNNNSNNGTAGNNNLNNPSFSLGQQFWKVPYHEFPNQRRGSIDSLPSDISARNINAQEQLFYNPSQQSPVNPNILGSNNSVTGSSSGGYWSYFRNPNSLSNQEEPDVQFRRSSSIPSLIRQTSNSILLGQTQLPHPNSSQHQASYPYSQFHQQPMGSNSLNPSISSFGQFASNGFQSRNNSIASEAMSPSAPAAYQTTASTPNINGIPLNPSRASDSEDLLKNDKKENTEQSITAATRRKSEGLNTPPTITPPLHADNKDGNTIRSSKKRKRNYSGSQQHKSEEKRNSSNLHRTSMASLESMMATPASGGPTMHNSCGTNRGSGSSTILYGQITDVKLIDLYYEFIHVGFPIIPLNKRTLTNDILLINTQPISAVHELNNYVILWFRNSLELLVRLAIKKSKNGNFFDSKFNNPFEKDDGIKNKETGNKKSMTSIENNEQHDNSNNDDMMMNEMFELQSIFISALNECFQKVVDIHPKFRENKELISPKVKIIYLSTFIILNYILSFVGYDNSFVLGMSVTIFNEFKLYRDLLIEDINREPDFKDDNDMVLTGCTIVFRRLYILLIILDSLQSCTFGGPKLLNMPIKNTVELCFTDSNIGDGSENGPTNLFRRKWCVEEDPVKIGYIIQALKLGEFLTELSMNRRSINTFTIDTDDLQNLVWEPTTNVTDHMDGQPLLSVCRLFHNLLITKHKFIKILLSLNNEKKDNFQVSLTVSALISDTLCDMITQILHILTLTMRLNPTNSIDPNYRPASLSPTGTDGTQSGTTTVGSTPNNATPSDFYQKLLGLTKDKDKGTDAKRGIITPYSFSMIHELHNIINIIRQLPTQLIGIVMQVAYVDNMKAQNIVVRLSNSMNEIVQIMSLLNMIKPFKIFETDLNERVLVGDDDVGELVMKSKFIKNARFSEEGKKTILRKFTDIGWKLLDDSELGWF